MSRVVTFTNLFPSVAMPTHGIFVYERMRRVAAAGGFAWTVVAPLPRLPFGLRLGPYRQWELPPASEEWGAATVLHPRYRHWPKFGMRGQALRMARGARAVVAALARREPIVLDAHYLWPDGVAAAMLAEQLRLPYVLTARGSDVNLLATDPVVASAIRQAAAGAVACCAVSAALAARFAAVAGLPTGQVQVIRNGVDLQRFQPGDAAAARAALGLPADGQLLLGVGRLVAGKGFMLAAAALAALPAAVQLVLVGEGPERKAIEAVGGRRVHCLGNLPPERVAMAMRAADLLVLPSSSEGWPNVVTEALAAGLRVVATPVGGIPEILGGNDRPDRRLGLLLQERSAAGLAQAVQELLAEPPQPGFVRSFAERYGWQEPVDRLVSLFRRLLSRGAA